MLKSTLLHSMGYNVVANNTGLIFIRLAVVSSQIREILRKFELTAVQSHPTSSILVPIESSYATSY